MTEITVDLTNYKDRVGARVAPGRYLVIVDDAELAQSKANNDMVNVWFRVLDGEFEGSTVVDRMTLTEAAMFRIVGFMQALGIPTPKKRLKINLKQFVGRTLMIDVEDGDPYNGRVKSEVRGYVKAAKAETAAGPEVADLDDLLPADEAPEYEAPIVDKAKAQETAMPVPVDVEDDGDVDLDSVTL